LSQKTTKNIFC